MPLDGSGVASKPAGTTPSPNSTIESAKFNSVIDDIYAIFNVARPIAKGGTGETTAYAAGDALSVKGADVASAATTDLGAATGRFVHVTGTTTITAFGTADAGVQREVTFDGVLTLTHNATSLILPGGTNITTAAGDTAMFVSEGSGNWRCINYQRAASAPNGGWELISTTAIAAAADWKEINLSAYRVLRIRGYVLPDTDSVFFRLRTSTNNGSTYDGGASDYDWSNLYGIVSTANFGEDADDQHINVGMSGAVGNAAGEGVTFDVTIHNFNKALFAQLLGNSSAITVSGVYSSGVVSGRRKSATARDALSLFFSSGNIASGFITLEGIRG